MGVHTYVGKHVLLNALSNAELRSVALVEPHESAEVRDIVTSHGVPEPQFQNLEFCRLYLESEKSWAASLRGHDAAIVTLGPTRELPIGVGKRGTDADALILTNAFKAMSAEKVDRAVVVLHSDESLSDHMSPRQLLRSPGAEPYSRMWRAMVDVKNRNEEVARIAHELASRYAPDVHITIVKPSRVLGTPADSQYGTSLRPLEQLLSRNRTGLADLSVHVINVRDLAELSTRLLLRTPDGTKFSEIEAATHTVYVNQIVSSVRNEDQISGNDRPAPNFVLRVIALFSVPMRSVVDSIGKHSPADSREARRMIGRDPISARDTFLETARFLGVKN